MVLVIHDGLHERFMGHHLPPDELGQHASPQWSFMLVLARGCEGWTFLISVPVSTAHCDLFPSFAQLRARLLGSSPTVIVVFTWRMWRSAARSTQASQEDHQRHPDSGGTCRGRLIDRLDEAGHQQTLPQWKIIR